jgi:RimJ/RimL family protein N-acetyltransferase
MSAAMASLKGLFGAAGRPGTLSAAPHLIAPQITRTPDLQIETDRLLLRPCRIGDFEACLAMSSDAEALRFSERGPMDRGEAWTRLLRHVGHWTLTGWGPFSVIEKQTGRFVGETGFVDFRRRLGPDFDGYPEVCLAISSWARGLDYGTEAVAAALAWIEREHGMRRSVALVHVENKSALNVVRKLGFHPFGWRVYRGYPAILVERG